MFEVVRCGLLFRGWAFESDRRYARVALKFRTLMRIAVERRNIEESVGCDTKSYDRRLLSFQQYEILMWKDCAMLKPNRYGTSTMHLLGRIRKLDRFANQTKFRYGIHEYAGSANRTSVLGVRRAKIQDQNFEMML